MKSAEINMTILILITEFRNFIRNFIRKIMDGFVDFGYQGGSASACCIFTKMSKIIVNPFPDVTGFRMFGCYEASIKFSLQPEFAKHDENINFL